MEQIKLPGPAVSVVNILAGRVKASLVGTTQSHVTAPDLIIRTGLGSELQLLARVMLA